MENVGYRKILLINLAGVGDILLSQPAVRALRHAYPQAKIWMLTSERVRQMQEDFTAINQWLTINIGYGGGIPLNGLGWLMRLLWRLRREKFDIAVNMRTLHSAAGSSKMRWLLRIIAARATAGRNTNGWGSFFTFSIPETVQGQKYEMEYDIELAELLGALTKDRHVTFTLQPQHLSRVHELLTREGIGPGDALLGIHPGGMPSRRWPTERFSRLIDMLYQEYHCRFVLTGSRAEADLCGRISSQAHTRVVSTAGTLSLRELGALIRRCNVFISNDTGPMHIAAVLQTPLVALFGPGDITRFDPRHIFPGAQVVYHRAPCAPCEKMFCPDGQCMDSISIEEVNDRVAQVMRL